MMIQLSPSLTVVAVVALLTLHIIPTNANVVLCRCAANFERFYDSNARYQKNENERSSNTPKVTLGIEEKYPYNYNGHYIDDDGYVIVEGIRVLSDRNMECDRGDYNHYTDDDYNDDDNQADDDDDRRGRHLTSRDTKEYQHVVSEDSTSKSQQLRDVKGMMFGGNEKRIGIKKVKSWTEGSGKGKGKGIIGRNKRRGRSMDPPMIAPLTTPPMMYVPTLRIETMSPISSTATTTTAVPTTSIETMSPIATTTSVPTTATETMSPTFTTTAVPTTATETMSPTSTTTAVPTTATETMSPTSTTAAAPFVCTNGPCDDNNVCTFDTCSTDIQGCTFTPVICRNPNEACDTIDGLCKEIDSIRPCIAVIDESDSFSDREIEAKWRSFRINYPTRPFCLLQPRSSSSDYLHFPRSPDFRTDPRVKFAVVNRDNGDLRLQNDWLQLCGYTNLAVSGIDFVSFFLDESGSMDRTTVAASLMKFTDDLDRANLSYCLVFDDNEDWITQFDTQLGTVGGGGACTAGAP